ncbi:MAG: trypsin-like peptidase domain-containing protein [Chloroflexi bacterium]|nr:trypsin-like peptidase domain-containing protein [Chloroflexota bacterium]
MRFGSGFLGALVGVVVGAAVVGGAVWAFDLDDDGSSGNAPAVTTGSQRASDNGTSGAGAGATSTDYTALYEKVRPSIVEITTGEQSSSAFDFSREGLGSGIVVDAEGHILTNYHVVNGFSEVTVRFADGSVAQAEVVGTDPGNDVAMVKAIVDDASVLKPAELGDSSAVQIGSIVAAIGNPFGLEGSFTTGVISGVDRTLPSSADGRPIRGLLQTDAAVNPGNSGGALISLDGKIIGINTAIETNGGGGGFAGVAYAVPINTPKRFLQELVAGDSIEHPRLGISGRTLTEQQAKDLGVAHGVAVLSVEDGSAADGAGLRSSSSGEGDVITAIDGVAMTKFEDLADYIDSKKVGDEVKLSVRRDGEDIELTAKLNSWNSSA